MWSYPDPSIGTIEILVEEWGTDEDGIDFYRNTPLKTHICTKEELGVVDEDSSAQPSHFMPVSERYKSDLKDYKDAMICIDSKEEMHIHGTFDTDNTRMMQI